MTSIKLRPRLVPQSSLDDPLLCRVNSPRCEPDSEIELDLSACYDVPDNLGYKDPAVCYKATETLQKVQSSASSPQKRTKKPLGKQK